MYSSNSGGSFKASYYWCSVFCLDSNLRYGHTCIVCDCLYDNRNHKVRVLSRILLMICALAYMIYVGMLIAVGSPQIWFAVSLIIVGITDVILSIKLVIS